MSQIILDILITGAKGALALVVLGYGAAMIYQAIMRQLQRARERVPSGRDYYSLIGQDGKPLLPVGFNLDKVKRQALREAEARSFRPLYIKAGR